jgi:hypothetical protein
MKIGLLEVLSRPPPGASAKHLAEKVFIPGASQVPVCASQATTDEPCEHQENPHLLILSGVTIIEVYDASDRLRHVNKQ